MPSILPDKVLENAVDVFKQAIRAIGINIGAAKGDVKITKDGAKIVEIAARLSGGFMSGSDAAMDFANQLRKVESLKQESGMSYLLELDKLSSKNS